MVSIHALRVLRRCRKYLGSNNIIVENSKFVMQITCGNDERKMEVD